MLIIGSLLVASLIVTSGQRAGRKWWDPSKPATYMAGYLLLLAALGVTASQLFWAPVFDAPFVRTVGNVLVAGGAVIYIWALLSWKLRMRSSGWAPSGILDTGPYRLVRHPSYAAVLVVIVGLALAFSGAWALLFILAYGFARRVAVEEETALASDPSLDYGGYAKRVPDRFVPGRLLLRLAKPD